ncbi:hypothetical protein AB0H77_12590 [Streptomyces sp. NPDC050844]|uniref:hypothetical protein n=1 Tax=Streptomyces sp. NPDC050844 TaxID=3155790 RepID=UPI0033C5429A
MIFTRADRAGEGKLSSRLGLVTDAVEAADEAARVPRTTPAPQAPDDGGDLAAGALSPDVLPVDTAAGG